VATSGLVDGWCDSGLLGNVACVQAQECAAPTVLKDRNQLKGARGSSETQVVRTEKKSTPRPTLRNRGWGTLRAFVSCVDRKERVVIVSGAEKRRRILSAPPARRRTIRNDNVWGERKGRRGRGSKIVASGTTLARSGDRAAKRARFIVPLRVPLREGKPKSRRMPALRRGGVFGAGEAADFED